jgi:hypothetical protein
MSVRGRRARGFLSVNPLPLAKRPHTDEPNLPHPLRVNRLARETYFPENSGSVTHGEFAKAIQLQRESIRVQIIEQRGLQAHDHDVNDVLGLFFSPQRQSSLNRLGQLVTTSYACSHVVQIPFEGEFSCRAILPKPLATIGN